MAKKKTAKRGAAKKAAQKKIKAKRRTEKVILGSDKTLLKELEAVKTGGGFFNLNVPGDTLTGKIDNAEMVRAKMERKDRPLLTIDTGTELVRYHAREYAVYTAIENVVGSDLKKLVGMKIGIQYREKIEKGKRSYKDIAVIIK